MTELKTLKEVQANKCKYHNGDLCPTCLKQEAIKWVQELKECENPTSEWIKHFFNITEEDLEKEK